MTLTYNLFAENEVQNEEAEKTCASGLLIPEASIHVIEQDETNGTKEMNGKRIKRIIDKKRKRGKRLSGVKNLHHIQKSLALSKQKFKLKVSRKIALL